MDKRQILQNYVNNFRRHIASFLRPSVGLSCTVYPATGAGAVLEFTIGPEIANEDHFRDPMPSVNDALAHIQQRAFGGNLKGFHFGGTNVIAEGNRIIFIKGGDSPSEWGDQAALDDVARVVKGARRL